MKQRGRVAANRIPISGETHEMLRDFKNGIGGDASFDDAMRILLTCIVRDGEDPFAAGKRLRELRKQGDIP